MADASEVFAEQTFRYHDTEYTLRPLGFQDRGRFCTWVEKENIDTVRRHKADYGDDFGEALGRLRKVRWGSKEWIEALNHAEPSRELAYLMLKESHPTITREQIEEMWDEPGGHIEIVNKEHESTMGEEIAQKMSMLLNRPNSRRPETAPGAR